MKKFITRSLFAFVIMGFALVSVNAATVYEPDDWTDGSGYGTATEVETYITNIKGETTAVGGMYVGPFSKKSTQTLDAGITEELLIDLDFNSMTAPEFFEVSLALNDDTDAYLDEAVVMTQMVEEGKVKLTAGWAPDFEAEVTEDGVYTYRWEVYKENGKSYVKFSLVDNGTVVATTGAKEFASLNVDGVSVRYVWFCNVNVAEGVNVYSRLPKLTVDEKTNSDYITLVDAEKVAKIVEESAKVDFIHKGIIERIDTIVKGGFEKLTKEEMKADDEDFYNLFEEKIKNDTIVNFFTTGYLAIIDGAGYHSELPIFKYNEAIDLNLVLPTDLPAVPEKHERKYYLIKFDMADLIEKLLEEGNDLDNIDTDELVELLELEVVEPTLSKDGKTLNFASDSYDMYALTYIDSQLPPKTGDNITTYVIMGIISMLGLAAISLKIKKSFN